MNRIRPDSDPVIDLEENKKKMGTKNNDVRIQVINVINKSENPNPVNEETEAYLNFWRSAHLMTASMYLFGLYFKSDCELVNSTRRERIMNKFCRVYSLLLMIINWMNLIRCLTIFTVEHQFGPSVLGRLPNVIWYVMTTAGISCMHLACRSGKLYKATMSITNSEGSQRLIRKRVMMLTLLAWVNFSSCTGADLFSYYWYDKYFDNNILTPVYTLISPDGVNILAMKTFYFVIGAYANANLVFPIVFAFLLTTTFWNEFSCINKQLEEVVRASPFERDIFERLYSHV